MAPPRVFNLYVEKSSSAGRGAPPRTPLYLFLWKRMPLRSLAQMGREEYLLYLIKRISFVTANV